MNDLRIGQGFDIHPFKVGRPLILGGVTVPSAKGLDGHSDADALCHAITDAILGAAGKGDIGTLFPDSDPQWKGANSVKLLSMAWSTISAEGWQVVNVDCMLLAQVPKLAPHIAEMKKNIGAALGIFADRVGVKATTTERLGFVGREEGIAASAVVLISR